MDPSAEGLDPFHKKAIEDKIAFRQLLCFRVSLLRLDYMFTMLNRVHPYKASMLGAEVFKVKLWKMEKREDKRKKFASKKRGSKSSGQS